MDNKKQIFINSTIGSSRAATVENKVLTDLYIDFPDHKKMVGNIYKGKVQNVIPGMQAAFVDIGYHINAFLPFTEISQLSKINDIAFSVDDKGIDNKHKGTYKKIKLEIGDDIMVQVIKESFLMLKVLQ